MESNTKLQDSIKSAKMLTGGVIKQGGQINHIKKALLKLFKSQKFLNHSLYITLIIFVYKCASYENFFKIYLIINDKLICFSYITYNLHKLRPNDRIREAE